ncbi:MAG: septum formation initiator family protein [Pyrinomonadaceae bacterium]
MSKKKRAKLEKRQTSTTPQWFVFAVIVSITFMVCIAINLRAFSELRAEMTQHETLTTEIEQLTTENELLQKEVKGLKTDSRIIEREARKIGMSRPNEKILVPVN